MCTRSSLYAISTVNSNRLTTYIFCHPSICHVHPSLSQVNKARPLYSGDTRLKKQFRNNELLQLLKTEGNTMFEKCYVILTWTLCSTGIIQQGNRFSGVAPTINELQPALRLLRQCDQLIIRHTFLDPKETLKKTLTFFFL